MKLANITLEEMTEALNRAWAERDSCIAMLLQEERAGVDINVPTPRLPGTRRRLSLKFAPACDAVGRRGEEERVARSQLRRQIDKQITSLANTMRIESIIILRRRSTHSTRAGVETKVPDDALRQVPEGG